MLKQKIFRQVFVISVLICLIIGSLEAAEKGKGVYLLGTRDIRAGMIPGKGFYLRNDIIYMTGVTNSITVNGHPYYDLKTWAGTNKTTFNYVPGFKIFRGKYMASMEIFINNVEMRYVDGYNGHSTSVDSKFGLGQIMIMPAALGWHGEYLHFKAYLPVYMPIGNYDADRLVNVSTNHFAIDPGIALTWYNKSSDTEFSGSAGLTVNFKNPETKYRNGEELHFDFAAIQRFKYGSRYIYGLGVVGYVYRQIIPDSQEGANYGNLKGKANAIGPIFTYHVRSHITSMEVIGKIYFKFGEENYFSLNSYWLGINFIF